MNTKPPSGGAKMTAQGKSLIWATFTADEKQIIRLAAACCEESMAQFVTGTALAAAKKILAKKQITP